MCMVCMRYIYELILTQPSLRQTHKHDQFKGTLKGIYVLSIYVQSSYDEGETNNQVVKDMTQDRGIRITLLHCLIGEIYMM